MTCCVGVMCDHGLGFASDSRMPLDLIAYLRDSLKVDRRRRFDKGDPYSEALSAQWGSRTRQALRQRPTLEG